MQFAVTCSCGAQIPVAAVDAGGTTTCRCGKSNAVPALSQLRRQAGLAAYEVAPAERIRLLDETGCLETQTSCAGCGGEASAVFPVTVVCERAYTKSTRPSKLTAAIGILFFSWWWLLARIFHDEDRSGPERITHGRDVVVKTPLRLCSSCLTAAGKQKRNMRELLMRVPLYEPLVRDYPEADIQSGL